MVRSIFVLFVFFLSLSSFAEAKRAIEGQATFFKHESDSVSLVKSMLVHLSTRDLVSKTMTESGLNSDLFWREFDRRFEEEMAQVETELQKDVVANPMKTQTVEDIQRLQRMKRLEAQKSFGQLGKLLSSYSIKEYGQSLKNPHSYYMTFVGEVSKPAMLSLYKKFVKQAAGSSGQDYYLSLEVDLSGVTYEELGLEGPETFKNTLLDHWSAWLSQQLGDGVKQIIQVKDEVSLKNLEGRTIQGEGIWLRLNFTVSSSGEVSSLTVASTAPKKFDVSGRFWSIDLKSNKLLYSSELVKRPMELGAQGEGRPTLASNVATFFYHVPIGSFEQYVQKVKSFGALLRVDYVTVTGHQGLGDLLLLSDLLTARGMGLGLQSTVSSLGPSSQARLEVRFSGAKEELAQLLKTFQGLDLGPGLSIARVHDNLEFVLEKKSVKIE